MKNLFLAVAGVAALATVFWFTNREDPQNAAALAKFNRLRPPMEKEPKPEYPGKAAEYMAQFLKTPNNENPAAINWQVKQETLDRQNSFLGASTLLNLKFEEMGPGNFGGRVRAIVIKPSDEDQILIGGVDGGVWKTTEGGESWYPVDDFLTNMAISSMVIDPDNDDTVFLGTGEGFGNVDAARGLGVFQSNDFGDTWTQLASTNNSNFFYVNRLAMIPGTDIIIAACRSGIYRSTDHGANWTEVSGISPNSRGFVDVKVDPSDPTRLFASHFGANSTNRFIMRSTDSGASWTQLGASEGLPTTNLGRIEIGIGSDGVVYLAISNSSNATNGMYRSPAGGNTFVKTASSTSFIERQGWYDLIMAVDPSDSDTVYSGAVDIYSSNNAGATITRATFWNPAPGQIPEYVHADIHNLTFFPSDPQSFLIGCDGGVFKSTDGGETYDDLNNDLRLAQYYGLSVSPNADRANGGTQDNGSHLFFGDKNAWLMWFGGDGGFAAWDQQDPNFIYGSTPGGVMHASNNGGNSAVQIPLPGGSGAQFIQPFAIDPNDGNRMIVGGTSVYFEDNLRALDGTWANVSGVLGTINATTISPHDGATAFVGRTNGAIFKTTGLGSGGAWNNISTGTGLPNSSVTWIEIDPTDNTGNTVYATFASYSSNRLWKSTDGGNSWASISGNLPDIPLFCVRVDPTDSNRLFVGSELGLWSTDGANLASPNWEHYSYGLAWSRTMQLHWASDGSLWIATHGRSIYRAIKQSAEISFGDLLDPDCDSDGYLEQNGTAEIPISITNSGGFPMENVMASVSDDFPSLTINNSPLAYGTIMPGQTTTQNISISLGNLPNCLDIANLSIDITDDTGNVGQDVLPITLGADPDLQSGLYFDGAEGTTLFTSEALLGNDDWAQVTTQANSGSQSWFTANVGNFADKSLISPWLSAGGGNTVLSFALFYDLEGAPAQYFDGAVLELRTQGGDWEDIGHLSTVPYDGQLYQQMPLEYRFAWSGTQKTWRDAQVDLGTTYSGQTIQFRFRVACDINTSNVGFWVDDISMTNVTWLAGLICDTSTCCFSDLPSAQADVMSRLEDWPSIEAVSDFIQTLNNLCME